MSELKVRWGWLKFMYIYTIVGAGASGLGVLLAPKAACAALGWPRQDPVVLGIVGSVYVAFAVVSAFALRSPLKFSPVLVVQLAYKTIWLVGVVLPLLATGRLPAHAILLLAVYLTYIVGGLIAIPFGYVFGREA